MAFFKFRWPGQSEPVDKPVKRSRVSPSETVEAMRRRARHRLIGAALLVLLGIVGFPLLFDTQPRPVPVDIPIEIPDRNKASPLVMPGVRPDSASAASKVPVSPSQPGSSSRAAPERFAPSAGLGDGEEIIASGRTAPKPSGAASVLAKPDSKPGIPESHEPPKASRPSDEAARARSLLEGRTAADGSASKAEDERFIVQVGAFADADKAREVRSKLERAGLKTYTQVVDTRDGKRTRVRVGPFPSRSDADKASAKIKSLDLSAAVLTL